MKLLHKLSSGSGLVTFALALIIVFLAFLGVSYLLEKPPVVKDLKLTNLSDSSVTVTYLTEEPSVGSVIVSTTNNFDILGQFSKVKFYDDRDDGVARKTHHVTIKGMLPEALYYFRISSGFKNADVTYPSIETATTPDTLRTPDPSYAKLTNQTNSDALVFYTLNNGTLQSTYLNSDSAFTIDKANIKTADLKGNITYKEGDEINVTVVDGGGSTRTLKTKVGEDQPINMQGFIDQTDGTSSTNLNKSLVSGVYAQGCNVREYPERYCQETKDGLCCKSAVRTIKQNADCSYSTTGDGMDSQSHDCSGNKAAEANKSTTTTDTKASSSGQSNEADKGCGTNRVVTYKKDLNCDTGKKIKVWVNEVCANGKITLQPGDATSEPCGELTTTQAGGLSKGGLSQTTQEAAKKAEEDAKAKATPKDSGAQPQEGTLTQKAAEALREVICGDGSEPKVCYGGYQFLCSKTSISPTLEKCDSDLVKANDVCNGKGMVDVGVIEPVCASNGYIYNCKRGDGVKTETKCTPPQKNYDSLCPARTSDSDYSTKSFCNPENSYTYNCINGKAERSENKCTPEVVDPICKNLSNNTSQDYCNGADGKYYSCPQGNKSTKATPTGAKCNVDPAKFKEEGEAECAKEKSKQTPKIICTGGPSGGQAAYNDYRFSVTYKSTLTGNTETKNCAETSLKEDCAKSDKICTSGVGCMPKVAVKSGTDISATLPVTVAITLIGRCSPTAQNCDSNAKPYDGSYTCTKDGVTNECCDGKVKGNGTSLGKKTQSWCDTSGALNNSIVSPASAQAVLGTSDSTATEVKVDSSGKYKVTDVKGYQIVNSEVWVLDTGTANTGSLKFFEDKNRNSIKDEGEEYITTPLEVKVEKQSDVVKYEFVAGWNLISYNLAEGSTASKLISSINGFGGYATHVATYTTGSWMMYSERAGQKLGSDFKLVPGKGYFVKVIKPVTMYIEGKLVEKDQSIYLNTGWNLVGLRSTVTGAKNLIEEVNKTPALNLDTVTRLESGRYENLVSDGTTFYGNDFELKSEKGYFIRLKKGGASWMKK